MKTQRNYTVFISYRRDGGFETATLIADRLRHAGYRVFFDVESLRAGKFNESLYNAIDKSKDFILVLPKDGLGRCVNEVDWVRKEIIHAMQRDKNIIPVTLSGFQWPEAMPQGLEGLEDYQRINAGDYQNFDASIERLKTYLKSSPRSFAQRTIVKVLILIAVLLFAWWGVRELFKPIAVEQADKMTAKISVIDMLVSHARQLDNDWNKFYNEYADATPSDTSFLKRQMSEALAFRQKEINSLKKDISWELSAGERQKLNFVNVNPAELETFHVTFYPSFFDDMDNYINLMTVYLNYDDLMPISVSSSAVNRRGMEYSANMAYYGYLELLSVMPKAASKSFHKLSPIWKNLPVSTASLYLPQEEYERLQSFEEENLKGLTSELGYLTTEQTIELERAQKRIKELKANAEAQQKANDEVTERVNNIKKLSDDIILKQQQLQEMEEKIEASYRKIIDNCKLSPGDDQYLMWGKIVRIATQMDKMAASRKSRQRQNQKDKEAAIAKGYDVSNWFEVSYSLTTRDILNEVNYRLDEYQGYFPATKTYVPAVKKFYSEVQSGKRVLEGLLVMGTKDDIPHPVVEVGDIVIARKGKSVSTTAEYRSVKDLPGEDTITFLRLTGSGGFEKYTKVVPQTEVLIGFLGVKEE